MLNSATNECLVFRRVIGCATVGSWPGTAVAHSRRKSTSAKVECPSSRPFGAWTCISKAEFIGPTGRIQVAAGSTFTRGTNFMGVDLAEWLEHQLKLDQRKP